MKWFMRHNFTDHLLFFIIGALNPVFLLISASTGWSQILTPLIVLGMVWGGCTNLVALRKKLFDKPGLDDIPPPVLPKSASDNTPTDS